MASQPLEVGAAVKYLPGLPEIMGIGLGPLGIHAEEGDSVVADLGIGSLGLVCPTCSSIYGQIQMCRKICWLGCVIRAM